MVLVLHYSNHYINRRSSWSAVSHITSFRVCQLLVTVCLFLSSHTDSKQVVVLPPCHSVIILQDSLTFYKNEQPKEEISQQGWKFSKKKKWSLLKVKFELNINEAIEEIADHGILILVPLERLQICSQRNLVNIQVSTQIQKVVVT